jgi:hypothetical protein
MPTSTFNCDTILVNVYRLLKTVFNLSYILQAQSGTLLSMNMWLKTIVSQNQNDRLTPRNYT